MKKYEMMTILRPDLDEENQKQVVERLDKILTDNGAEITKVEEMGKRRLAYEIDKYRDGVYRVVYFQSEPEAVNEFDRLAKIDDDVIRFMTIRDERED